ncbi:hypothetical protein SB6411_00219 [Klebsiella spallanzanii]|uniref:ATP-binding protein n=1 Tax=Klebsiella spallanzanii TaxID=2587528 RepID=A0ABY6V4U5_9ENTR|nr:ATP-binding protein [Klebsiella spallanzanii]VUS22731.1 hypothetical protein SB6411_00219 [Klebsiella spallanzanii]
MSNPFERIAERMDAATVRKMGKAVTINGEGCIAIESHLLAEMGAVNGDGISLVVFTSGYTPRRNDVVEFEGRAYQVTQHRLFNRKPQIWIE